MAKLLKLRRGTTTQHGSFTGAEGEVTVDTDKETLVVHDGSTAGGHPVAAEDLANVSSSTIAGRLANDSIAVSKIAAGTLPSDVKVTDSNVSGNLTIESADIVDGTIVNADINGSAAIGLSKLATGALPSGITVASANIVDGTITNGDVNAGAAIAGTKVSPDFGSQSIVTTGNILLNGDSTGASNHRLTFGSQSGGDLAIYHDGSHSRIQDAGTGDLIVTSSRLQVNNAADNEAMINAIQDGSVELYFNGSKKFETNNTGASLSGNLDVSNGVDVTGNLTVSGTVNSGATTITGNIAVSGTVDGRDVAADGTKLDGIESGATGDQTNAEIRAAVAAASDSNVFTDAKQTILAGISTSTGVIVNGVTATTQSAGDNSTKVATTAYTDTAVSNLVDSAPGALNTLNELAAAVNDDANFSTTITNSIATKMPLAGGEFTGNVTCENITPDGDSSRNLGTNSVRFANVYADNFVGGGGNLTGVESFVSGMIILWSGSVANIPSGFVLCNGSNSTPDLRDRFVVGAGNNYAVGATGGATTATDNVSVSGSDTVSISASGTASITVSGTTGGNGAVSAFQGRQPGASHQFDIRYVPNYQYFTNSSHTHSFSGSGSDTVSVSGSDTVNITGTDTVSVSTLSPYYALCYIMKT